MENLLTIKSLRVARGGREILEDLSFTVAEGDFFTVLGPSGVGKTTLLDVLNGFLSQTRGEIRFRGKDISAVPSHKRAFGRVFQDLALFPHLDVYHNIAFGLEIKKLPADQIKGKVDNILQALSISHLKNKYPTEVSGGEKQRVAFARALVVEPEILLLDEPFSNLDLEIRKDAMAQLKAIQSSRRITIIYVTHDSEEAFNLSTQIAILHNGAFQQIAAPEQIYRRPANLAAAQYSGGGNFLRGRISEVKEGGYAVVDIDGQNLRGILTANNVPSPGEDVTVFFRSTSVKIECGGVDGNNSLACEGVANIAFFPDPRIIFQLSPSGQISVRVTEKKLLTMEAVHRVNRVSILPDDVFVYPRQNHLN